MPANCNGRRHSSNVLTVALRTTDEMPTDLRFEVGRTSKPSLEAVFVHAAEVVDDHFSNSLPASSLTRSFSEPSRTALGQTLVQEALPRRRPVGQSAIAARNMRCGIENDSVPKPRPVNQANPAPVLLRRVTAPASGPATVSARPAGWASAPSPLSIRPAYISTDVRIMACAFILALRVRNPLRSSFFFRRHYVADGCTATSTSAPASQPHIWRITRLHIRV